MWELIIFVRSNKNTSNLFISNSLSVGLLLMVNSNLSTLSTMFVSESELMNFYKLKKHVIIN